MQTQQPRAGRPRMEEPDADISGHDEESSRRARMRLAQRKYRSKKHDALAAAELKATALESALRGTLSAFRSLQTSLLQQPAGHVPLDVAVAVSQTSLEISSLLHSSGVQAQDTLGCQLLDCAQTTCARRVLSERLTRAVAELNLQSLKTGGLGCFTPELLAGLDARPSEMLLAQPQTQTPGATDMDYAGRCILPPLYRKTEGVGYTVLRLAPPKLQRLQYGLTRTWFDTDVPALAGEWLEAVDVEEYLAQRGIHVRDPAQKVVTLRLGGSDAEGDSSPTSAQPCWEPELPDWTIFGMQLDEQQDVPRGSRAVVATPEGMGQLAMPPQGKISIDVDKLITGLSRRSICLGPAPGIRRHHVDEAIQEAVLI